MSNSRNCISTVKIDKKLRVQEIEIFVIVHIKKMQNDAAQCIRAQIGKAQDCQLEVQFMNDRICCCVLGKDPSGQCCHNRTKQSDRRSGPF